MSGAGERRQARVGQGSARRPGNMRRIVVAFDDETFAQVRAVAIRERSSFGAAVRLLVEFGLEDAA